MKMSLPEHDHQPAPSSIKSKSNKIHQSSTIIVIIHHQPLITVNPNHQALVPAILVNGFQSTSGEAPVVCSPHCAAGSVIFFVRVSLATGELMILSSLMSDPTIANGLIIAVIMIAIRISNQQESTMRNSAASKHILRSIPRCADGWTTRMAAAPGRSSTPRSTCRASC